MDESVIAAVSAIYFALLILFFVSLWKIFSKAGQPGWASIVPVYNLYVILKIAGKPGWWLLLFLVPLVNFIIFVMAMMGMAKNFGKDGLFAVGMILLSFVFYPILAFGDAKFTDNHGEITK